MHRFSLAQKLLFLFITVGVVPAAITAFMGGNTASRDMQDRTKVTFSTLAAARDNKAAQLGQYLEASRVQVENLASTAGTFRDLGYQKLDAVRNNKHAAVAEYFQLVQDQARTLAGAREVRQALRDCSLAFGSMGQETGRLPGVARQSLAEYYESQFGATYGRRNGGRSVDTAAMLGPLNDEAAVMQAAYIAENPIPWGRNTG